MLSYRQCFGAATNSDRAFSAAVVFVITNKGGDLCPRQY